MRWTAFLAGAGAFLGAAILAACTVVVEDSPRANPPGSQSCSREYRPVCAKRGNDRETFSNACLAEAAGYRVIREGQCRGGGNDEERFCTREYQPVCGRRDGRNQTFDNACLAEENGYRVIASGRCEALPPPAQPQPPAPQPPAPQPPPPECVSDGKLVCGRRGAEYQTLPDRCFAIGSGFEVIHEGACSAGMEQKP